MLKIAGIQMHCHPDPKKNLEKAKNLALIAAERGAKIICFQELFHTHWFPADINSTHFQLAESIPGPITDAFSMLALQNQIVIILPMFERDEQGNYFNTAAVIDANGQILGKYRKLHIPQIPLWEEKFYFQPGNLGYPVFATKYARVGIQICWDNFFPEGARILALKSAQIIFSPTAAALATQAKWEKVICANAAMSGLFIFRVNRVGKEAKQHFYGQSFCADPEGELVDLPSGRQEGIVMVDLDLQEIERTRRVWTFLSERRPEIYGEILSNLSPLSDLETDLAEEERIQGQFAELKK